MNSYLAIKKETSAFEKANEGTCTPLRPRLLTASFDDVQPHSVGSLAVDLNVEFNYGKHVLVQSMYNNNLHLHSIFYLRILQSLIN